MKINICVAVVIIVDIPDGGVAARVPAKNPLDELAARLCRDAHFGRDSISYELATPDMAAWIAEAFCQSAV